MADVLSPRMEVMGMTPLTALPALVQPSTARLDAGPQASGIHPSRQAKQHDYLNTSFVVRSMSRDGAREDLSGDIAFQHQMRHNASRAERNPKRDGDLVPDELKGMTLSQIEKRLRYKMVKRYADLKRAFVAFDKQGTGMIKLEELKRVLDNFVFRMNDFLFERIMDRCGIRASHEISYELFLEKFQPVRQDGLGHSLPIKPNHILHPIRGGENEKVDIKEIWTKLKDFVEMNTASLKETFLKFDDNRMGFVNHKKFRQVMNTFNLRLADADFKRLMVIIDPQKTNKIRYQEFLNIFEIREDPGAHPWLDRVYAPKKSKKVALDQDTIENILRHKLQDNWKSIYQAFLDIDTDQNGFIERQELGNLLNSYAVPLMSNQLETLWKKCDINNKGRVSFLDFMKYMGIDILSADKEGPSTRIHKESDDNNRELHRDQDTRFDYQFTHRKNMTSSRPLSDIMAVLKDKINEKAPDFYKLFVKYDVDGDGRLSKKEFHQLLSNFGLEMDDHQYKALTKEMNFVKGYLKYPDFLYFFQETRLIGHGEHLIHVPNHRWNKIKEQTDSMSPEEALDMIRKKMEIYSKNVREAFTRLDFDHDGMISRAEFRRMIDQFMMPLSKKNFDAVLRLLGIGNSKLISFNHFVDLFERRDDLEKGHPWLFGPPLPSWRIAPANMAYEEALKVLKEKTADQWRDACTAFQAFDRDGNMVIKKREFASVLHTMNIYVAPDTFKALWMTFDTDNNGTIDYHEFVAVLGDVMGPIDQGVSHELISESCGTNKSHHNDQESKHDDATKCQISRRTDMDHLTVETVLRDKFRDKCESLRSAFLMMDRNRDGFVTRDELQSVLQEFHLFMSAEEFNKLLNKIGLGNKTKIAYVDFLKAFEDPRLCGNMRTTLDVPANPQQAVTFDTAETMTDEEAILVLRNKVAENPDTIKQAFNAFDKSGEGRVTREDLRQIMDAFCLQLSNSQFNYLLKQLDVAEDGTVSYKKFMESFQKTDAETSFKWAEENDPRTIMKEMREAQKEAELEACKPQVSPRRLSPLEKPVTPRVNVSWTAPGSPPTTSADVERRISSKVMQKWQELNRSFKIQDYNSTGKVSLADFKNVLCNNGIPLSESDIACLTRKYDIGQEGRIPYSDFMKKMVLQPRTMIQVGGDETSRSSKLPADVKFDITIQTIKSEISYNDKWKKLRRDFKQNDDKDRGEGFCTYDQFRDTLRKLQIDIEDNDYHLIASSFDEQKNGLVNYNWFLRHTLAS